MTLVGHGKAAIISKKSGKRSRKRSQNIVTKNFCFVSFYDIGTIPAIISSAFSYVVCDKKVLHPF